MLKFVLKVLKLVWFEIKKMPLFFLFLSDHDAYKNSNISNMLHDEISTLWVNSQV